MQSQSTAKAASALSLRWTVGMNVSLPSMVHSLAVPLPTATPQSSGCPFSLSAADYTTNILYATSHTAVSHDLARDAQFLLQGHCNAISSVSVSSDKKTVVTADAAQDTSSSGDCVIVLWDPSRGVPVKSFSARVPAGGIRSMDLSPDARLLVTLSNGSPQVVQVWDLAAPSENEAVLAQHSLDADFEHQHFVRFNPIDIHDIVTNGATRAVFWSWTANDITPLHPPHAVTKLRAKIGAMTQTAYLPHTSRVISGTLSGEVVVWDYPHAGATCRHPVKIIKLSGRSCGLNLIEVVNKYVVAASTDGAVRFYDFQFRVLGWLEDLQAGEITSISFAQYTPEASVIASATAGTGLSNPSAAAAATDELLNVPPFIVSTTAGKVVLCDSFMMNHIDPEVRRGRLLLSGLDGDCNALSAHPCQPYFAVGTSNGTVSIWNFEQHVAQRTRAFDRGVTCVQYSPNGHMLAVGLEDGSIILLKTVFDATESNAGTATTIDEIQTLNHSNSAITHISFAADNEHIAYADASRHVGLFRYFHIDEDHHRDKEWIYVGRFKAHTKPITSLFFNGQGVVCFDPTLCDEPSKHSPADEKPVPAGNSISAKDKNDQRASKRAELIRGAEQWEGNRLRLYTFGRDGRLNEFDVGESWIRTGLCLKRAMRIDQTGLTTDALPLYLLNSVDLALPRGADPSDPLISSQCSLVPYWLTSGSDHKLRAWREDLSAPEDDGTGNLVCVKTSAAPTYGGPVAKMLLLPTQKGADSNNQYLFYTTAGKVVGLLKLPLDGHPSKSMALIAHATPVTAITNSFDGKFVITGGGADRCINVWAVSPQEFEGAIESAAAECGTFEDLLEGGKGGELYNEIVDYFVYAQLRSQSKGHRDAHALTGTISAQDAVNLLRSLHCYPTQTEIQHLVHELAFEEKVGNDDTAGGNAISLTKFIELFFNHRPAVGVRKSEFEAVFRLLKEREESEVESFKDGDAPLHGVSRDKLVELLQTHGEPMSQAEVAFCFDTLLGTTGQTEVSEEELEQELLPSQLTADHFASRVLGFGAASQ